MWVLGPEAMSQGKRGTGLTKGLGHGPGTKGALGTPAATWRCSKGYAGPHRSVAGLTRAALSCLTAWPHTWWGACTNHVQQPGQANESASGSASSCCWRRTPERRKSAAPMPPWHRNHPLPPCSSLTRQGSRSQSRRRRLPPAWGPFASCQPPWQCSRCRAGHHRAPAQGVGGGALQDSL